MAALLLAACDEEQVESTPSTGAPLCSASSAQVVMDLAGPVANYTWNDPHVFKEGLNYRMYASATNFFAFPVELFRLSSTDGLAWALDPGTQSAGSSLLPIGTAAGTWDDGGAETPGVVYFGGKYHLFYTTYATHPNAAGHSVSEFRIGHAVSADGISGWTVDDVPVVSPGASGEFHEFVVGEPAPVVFNSKLYLYFTAAGVNPAVGSSLQVIGLTTSDDGVNWTTPVSVLEPDQAVFPRAAGWFGFSTPFAIEHGGQMHLFTDVAFEFPSEGWTQVRLHHAVSADGMTGWTQARRPLLTRDQLPWTAREVRSPSALDDNGTLRLYFAGDDVYSAGTFSVGVTTCPGIAW